MQDSPYFLERVAEYVGRQFSFNIFVHLTEYT
jgi:hypothetical protein